MIYRILSNQGYESQLVVQHLYRLLREGKSQAHLEARVEGAVFWVVRVGHGPGWKCMKVEDQDIAGAKMDPWVAEEVRIEEYKATACLLRVTTQHSISFLNSVLSIMTA